MELLLKVFALCVITAAVASLLRRNEGELALLLAVAAGLSYIKYKIKTLLKNAAEKKG